MAAAASALELPVAPGALNRRVVATHELLLLAGKPIYRRAMLPADLEVEATITVDGRGWVVAEVRQRPGEIPLVVCIHDA